MRRLGRWAYFKRTFVASILYGAVAGFMIAEAGGSHRGQDLALIVVPLSTLLMMALGAKWAVQRFRDLDRPWNHVFLLLIPVYNFFLGCLLVFKRGVSSETLPAEPLGVA